MSKIAQLREQRDIKARQANELNAKHPADQRMPTADAAALDVLLGEIETIDGEITQSNRVAQLAASGDLSNPATQRAQNDIALQAGIDAGRGNAQSLATSARGVRKGIAGNDRRIGGSDRLRVHQLVRQQARHP